MWCGLSVYTEISIFRLIRSRINLSIVKTYLKISGLTPRSFELNSILYVCNTIHSFIKYMIYILYIQRYLGCIAYFLIKIILSYNYNNRWLCYANRLIIHFLYNCFHYMLLRRQYINIFHISTLHVIFTRFTSKNNYFIFKFND